MELSTSQQECEWIFLQLIFGLGGTGGRTPGYVGKVIVETRRTYAKLNLLSFTDAANDSHAGLAIYRELVRRAVELDPAPEPDCFTFNAIKGKLRDTEGRPWFPINPSYDSGLPPQTTSSEVGTAFPGP
jgi:hypothetical protein